MKALYILYKFFHGSESAIDAKISKNKKEFEELDLKSENLSKLYENIYNSLDEFSRLKCKIDLNKEYECCIRWHYEYDVW